MADNFPLIALISGPLAGLAWAPPIRLSRLLSAL
jgi:hypothetical protein